jgi:hypothetical protein
MHSYLHTTRGMESNKMVAILIIFNYIFINYHLKNN